MTQETSKWCHLIHDSTSSPTQRLQGFGIHRHTSLHLMREKLWGKSWENQGWTLGNIREHIIWTSGEKWCENHGWSKDHPSWGCHVFKEFLQRKFPMLEFWAKVMFGDVCFAAWGCEVMFNICYTLDDLAIEFLSGLLLFAAVNELWMLRFCMPRRIFRNMWHGTLESVVSASKCLPGNQT